MSADKKGKILAGVLIAIALIELAYLVHIKTSFVLDIDSSDICSMDADWAAKELKAAYKSNADVKVTRVFDLEPDEYQGNYANEVLVNGVSIESIHSRVRKGTTIELIVHNKDRKYCQSLNDLYCQNLAVVGPLCSLHAPKPVDKENNPVTDRESSVSTSKSSGSSSGKYDYYGAKEYNNASEFADDYAEDFYDFEDDFDDYDEAWDAAYDYWEDGDW